jgi:hypothetical protein
VFSYERGAGKEFIMITVRDALNRGYNLLGVGIVAISGLSFFSDLPAEMDKPSHIVDEVLLAVLALMAFVWYLIGCNKYSRICGHHHRAGLAIHRLPSPSRPDPRDKTGIGSRLDGSVRTENTETHQGSLEGLLLCVSRYYV